MLKRLYVQTFIRPYCFAADCGPLGEGAAYFRPERFAGFESETLQCSTQSVVALNLEGSWRPSDLVFRLARLEIVIDAKGVSASASFVRKDV